LQTSGGALDITEDGGDFVQMESESMAQRLGCGADMEYTDSTTCTATWVPNKYGLKHQQWYPSERGIWRPAVEYGAQRIVWMLCLDSGSRESAAVSSGYCPVVAGWDDDKFQWCPLQWNSDHRITWPIPYCKGPSLFVYNLNTNENTTDLIQETRADDDKDLRCWTTCWNRSRVL
jgi:hypothetical protein